MVLIDTSIAAEATAYSNQRKVDRCQNGVLWSMFWNGAASTTAAIEFHYSTDDGATWTDAATPFGFAGTGTTYTPNASLFIDVDDFAHVVYKDRHDGSTYYRRGTPNAARTAWTWSAALKFSAFDTTFFDYPDVVAHRDGTGWQAHLVVSVNNGSTTTRADYWPLAIASDGTLTLGTQVISANYATGKPTWPSVDFNHTGDGKTVAGGTPHVYFAWSAGAAGAGLGIRFKKAVYDAGAWTWATEREIDPDTYAINDQTWVNCLFDGTRVIMPGTLYSAANGHRRQMLYERDAADTITTTRDVKGAAVTSTDPTWRGSASYDDYANVFFAGLTINTTTKKVGYRKWERASTTLEAGVYLADCEQNYLSARRGYTAELIELLYTDGSASPYSVTFDVIRLNKPPNAPTLTNPVGGATIDRTAAQRFTWDFNDPDTGDSQSAYRLYHRPVGASTWTVVEGTTPNEFHDFAAGYFTAGDHEWQVETADAQGEWGPRSASEFFTAATPPGAPTITDPTSGQTIPTESYPVQWSAPDQDAYQLRRVADNAGSPDTTTVYSDTGTVGKSTARSRSVDFPTNNRWEHVRVRIRHGGLWSQWASVRVDVSWTSPPAPSVTAVGNDTGGYIAVAIDNPPPVGDEPSVTDNDLYRRDVGDTGEGIRIARGITPDGTYDDYAVASRQDVEYRARANGANQTSALSAWAG